MFEMQTPILAASSLLFPIIIIDSLSSVTRPVQLSWLWAFWMTSSVTCLALQKGKKHENTFFNALGDGGVCLALQSPRSPRGCVPAAVLLKLSLLCVHIALWEENGAGYARQGTKYALLKHLYFIHLLVSFWNAEDGLSALWEANVRFVQWKRNEVGRL